MPSSAFRWFDMRVLPSHHALAQFAEDLYTTFSLGTHPFLEWDANRDRDEDYELSSDDGASSTDDEPSQDVEKPAKKKPKKSCKPDQVVSALPKPPAFFRRWMF